MKKRGPEKQTASISDLHVAGLKWTPLSLEILRANRHWFASM